MTPPDGSVARYDAQNPGPAALETLATAEDTPRALALELDETGLATSVYWATFAAHGQLVRLDLSTSTAVVLVDGLAYPNGIAVDGTDVYWSNRGDGTIQTLPPGASAGRPADDARDRPSRARRDDRRRHVDLLDQRRALHGVAGRDHQAREGAVTVKPAAPVAEGEVLAGKYRVEKVLGVGGMGVVVAATHATLRQKVAIKFLLPGASDEVVQRFLREARAAVRLRSDHVARVIDVGELESGAPFMVMEYLAGSDLSAVLRDRGALPIDEAVDYVLQACEAIAEAHVAGIVHRDLKPANLFLTKAPDGSPSVKVLDFGISKDSGGGDGEDEQGLTRTTAVLGSPHYMAPEQMRSTRSVDGRADIWSLGVILFQLLDEMVGSMQGAVVHGSSRLRRCCKRTRRRRKPDRAAPGLPPGLDAAILRCLCRDRDARFPQRGRARGGHRAVRRPRRRAPAERIARTQGVTIAKLLPGADADPQKEPSRRASPRRARAATLRSARTPRARPRRCPRRRRRRRRCRRRRARRCAAVDARQS